MTDYSLNDRWQENRSAWKDYWDKFTLDKFAIALIILALAIVGFGYFNQHGSAINWTNIFGDFYANVSSELISIVITVLVLERLNARRQDKQELTRLKALLKSNESVVTKIAIAELRARRWLEDGSLSRINLISSNIMEASLERSEFKDSFFANANCQETNFFRANLEGVDFLQANLRGAFLVFTNLKDADLSYANLEGAFLANSNLEDTIFNFTTLPDGTILLDGSENYDIERFTNPQHQDFESTRIKINAIRKEKGYKFLNL